MLPPRSPRKESTMRKCISLLLILLLLTGCGNPKGGNAAFTQKELPMPDRMEVQTGSATVEYLPDSEEYQKLFAALQPNWWKTTGSNKEDTAPDDKLFPAESPEQLWFKSNRTYRENGDTFLYFYYESKPFTWVNPTGPDSQLMAIAFLLPDRMEAEENVKSCVLTMENAGIGNLDGIFVYYFPPEIAASFWDFIRKSG